MGLDKASDNSATPIAIKLERTGKSSSRPPLERESRVIALLAGGQGIPSMRGYFRYGEYNAMALDLLGPDLGSLLKDCGGRFSLETYLLLAEQIVGVDRTIHFIIIDVSSFSL
jgi:casein kinase I family protein HRR25